jgi:heme oxygenase (biliverdin-producing, ferredoxin)
MFSTIVIALLLGVSNGLYLSSKVNNIFSTSGTRKTTYGRILHMHGGAATPDPNAPYSFVNTDMRAYAMKLHTREQLRPQGAPTPTPVAVAKWEPARINYVQFLVDSLVVFETMEQLAKEYPILAPLASTGLERSAVLKEDLQWISKTYNIKVPPPGPHGPGYSQYLRELAATNMPKYVSHYYNHMFAHTAGGRMIGKKMCDTFMDGTTLKFYQWEGDVKEHMKKTVEKIDNIANTWSEEQKKVCIEETVNCFRYSGALMVYMNPPSPELQNVIKYE